MAAPTGSSIGMTTLGNQERQDIVGANEWVEGNIDYWLESHLYDAEVRLEAGSGAGTVPNEIDIGMSFFFTEKNAIVIDWTQDWHVTLKKDVMFYTKTSAPPGAPYACSTPPNIVDIPVGGRSIKIPQAGSICIQDVGAKTTGNPSTGWANLMSLPLAQLNKVLPKRNEPCTVEVGGLCQSGAETEANPAKEHYFRVSLIGLFGPTGLYPQSWWPNLPGGQSIAVYFRNHLALTAIWNTAIGGPGGGSQAPFCITTGPGLIRNTNYNRCGWTTISRDGAGSAQGSKNHGTVHAGGLGAKTIPLPQVVAPTGFLTVCKIVTQLANDRTGQFGGLTNGWSVHVEGPFGTSMTKTTGSLSTGCARFGPLFPGSGYAVSEILQPGFVNIGTVVAPSTSRDAGFGVNPDPSNPVNVTLTFSQAQAGTGPQVTFVNFLTAPGLNQDCTVTITDANGAIPNRAYAIAGDTVTFTYSVSNTGNVGLVVTQTHTNTVRLGPNPIFQGFLLKGQIHTETRSFQFAKGDRGTVSDTSNATGIDSFGRTVYAPEHTCSVVCREPDVSFEKHPVSSDQATTVPGAKITYTIDVRNTGDAPATVTVSDALGAGQMLLNGGAGSEPDDMPSPTPTSPAGGADYPAPVTILWSGVALGPGDSVTLTFRVLVTTTMDNAVVRGTASVSAANGNGVDYSPDPSTAENAVTVHRPIVKLSGFGYTNTPNGTPTQGVVTGTTVYTVRFTNYGSADAILTGSLTVSVSGGGAGTFACFGVGVSGCVLSFADVVVASGDTVTFTVTLEYHELASGAVVSAALAATYVTSGSDQSYTPSGVPARIEFTVQGG
ncbi:MAG TPA: hypothetical protein VGR51_10740 [Thermoplasmata archaeon]|nr:hypothetical protein [Thermoplasmata archaeon]